MTDAPANPRPMTAADYAAGSSLPATREHPTRDLIIGAFVGAAALWLVPRILDRTVGDWLGGGEDGPEEYDLEVEG